MNIISLFVAFAPVAAKSEVGPEGHKLLWILAVLLIGGIYVLFVTISGKKNGKKTNQFFKRKKIAVELEKDRLYRPDFIKLTVKNKGSRDVDLDAPLLIFSGMWYKRKFKLKGTNYSQIYPLYLTAGQSHYINIELKRFYGFDRSLKRLPKVKVVISEVNGKKLGSSKVMLRQTLFSR